MFKLDRKNIMSLTGNETIYAGGRSLHENKHMYNFESSDDGRLLEADVNDHKQEHVKIQLDLSGLPISNVCTCANKEDFLPEKQLCRHQVALLLEARERQRTREAYPEDSYSVRTGGTLKLRKLLIVPPKPSMPLLIELETGTTIFRPVLDVSDFLKKWTCEKNSDKFSGLSVEDTNLLSFLVKRAAARTTADKSIFAESRALRISGQDIPALLDLASKTANSFWTDVTRKHVSVVEEPVSQLPFSLFLDGDMLLHLKSAYPLRQLNEQLTAFLVGNRFYTVAPNVTAGMKWILFSMQKSRLQYIALAPEGVTRFVEESMTEISDKVSITISPEAAMLLHKSPLEAVVKLFWDGPCLTAALRFRYGQWEVNPLVSQADGGLTPKRDKIRESRILHQFRQAGFLPINGRLALHADEPHYKFLRVSLSVLHEDASVETEPSQSKMFKIDPAPLLFSLLTGRKTGHLLGVIGFTSTTAVDLPSINELPEMARALRSGREYYRSADGRFFSLQDEGLPVIAGILEDPAVRTVPGSSNKFDIPFYRLPALAMLKSEQHFGRVVMDEKTAELSNRFFMLGNDDSLPPLPFLLESTLREYQKHGWRWLATLARFGFGGILADDMGLGKTVQIIALLHTLMKMPETVGKPVLIVAPSSLLLNWEAEFKKFAPYLRVVVMDGSKSERRIERQAALSADAVITSYSLLRRDVAELSSVCFSACILDEAQHIKNPDTANAHAVKQIQAIHRFAVTGTPLENTPTELWSVFDFLMPYSLHTRRQFVAKYEVPILKKSDVTALRALTNLVKPFILRRIKSDVLPELPEKIDMLSACEMTYEQEQLYKSFHKKACLLIDDATHGDKKEQVRMRIFAILTRLRQICCDPELVVPGCGAGSGKLDLLQEVLSDALDGGHRILLFSQFTSMLDRIAIILRAKGIPMLRLDGQTPIDKRLGLVNAFNAGEGRVFLVSLKAGGTGLNLTGADTVIHYDPWWNPAVEDQATDRAHRIGQQNIVQVIRLVTLGTIEEKIINLQERKRDLTDSIIKPGGTFLDALSIDEIRNLLGA